MITTRRIPLIQTLLCLGVFLTAAAGCTPDTQPSQTAYTTIIEAVENGDLAAVKRLVDPARENTEEKDFAERTPLLIAAEKEYIDIVRYLIEQGADVNAADNYGNTALLHAAEKGKVELTLLLVAHHADLEAAISGDYRKGYTPLLMAASRMADTVPPLGNPEAHRDFTNIVSLLVRNGANVRVQVTTPSANYKKGVKSPLVFAVKAGNEELVRMLIERGASVKVHDDVHGYTLPVLAMWHGERMVRMLIEAGADVNDRCEDGETVLMRAAEVGEKELVRSLLERGAKMNSVDDDGETALLHAGRNVHEYDNISAEKRSTIGRNAAECVKLLIEKGADIHRADKWGRTILVWEAINGNAENVKLLLRKGADRNARTEDGSTALTLARKNGRTEIVTLLEQAR